MTGLSRRGALGLLATALAAPAIIRTPGLLMLPPLKRVHLTRVWDGRTNTSCSSPVRLRDGKYVQGTIGMVMEHRFPMLNMALNEGRSQTSVRYMRTLPTEWYIERASA